MSHTQTLQETHERSEEMIYAFDADLEQAEKEKGDEYAREG